MTAIVIIPARFGSTRFPAKILAAETGKPLVQHVVDQARQCKRVRDVIVAADDPRIADALKPFKTRVVMTSPAHQSGTDRIAEVARGLEDEMVVNVQGDEPEIEPETIDGLIHRLETSKDDMATAATPFRAGQDPNDPNLVKVAIGVNGHAVYFSRSPIPHYRDGAPGKDEGGRMKDERSDSANSSFILHPSSLGSPAYHLHLGIYAYRRKFLLEYSSWEPTPLEKAEKLEQLRALEHGRRIYVLKIDRAVNGIDTPQQYAAFVKRFRGVAGCWL